VGDGGGEFAPARGGEIAEERVAKPSADISKCVPVEKKKRGGFVEFAEEIEGFEQRVLGYPFFFPALRARISNLWISAVLRASSCARCSVEADDKLPTPVFEKSGSAL
jgi:hypothetical protein